MDVEVDIAVLCIVNPPAPIATLMPKNRVYLTSLSKAVAPGLRIGCLSTPPDLLKRQASIIGASAWTAKPISAELTTRWIEDGTAEKILDSCRPKPSHASSLQRQSFDTIRYRQQLDFIIFN